MTSQKPAQAKIIIISAIAILGTAGFLAALWPISLKAAKDRSARFVAEAAQLNGGEAEVKYRLALWLDRSNTEAYFGLARLNIAANHPDIALQLLDQAGEGSEAIQLKVRTLLELGRTADAADHATPLTQANRPESDLSLAILTYALAGQTQNISPLMTRLTSPETLRRAERAQGYDLPLASELYATGLPKSSSALLMKLPASFERNLLLARIHYSWHTPTDLKRASTLLDTAITLNPASIEARELLANTYRDQGNNEEARRQDSLISKIQSHKP